jgi:hypothetical protein
MAVAQPDLRHATAHAQLIRALRAKSVRRVLSAAG